MLQENLKMSPAMLSRFDLVFLILDRPDPERDQRLTAHLMAIHSGIAPRAAAAARGRLALEAAPAPLLLTDGAGGGGGAGARRLPLLERLRAQRPDDEPLPVALLRKYIAYARQYVHPRLSGAAGGWCLHLSFARYRASVAGKVGGWRRWCCSSSLCLWHSDLTTLALPTDR